MDICKKRFYTYLYVSVNEWREEEKKSQQRQKHVREKKIKRYAVNSEKE